MAFRLFVRGASAMPHANDDTIVAVSSPPGRSPRGLIRITGPRCLNILSDLATPIPPDRILTPCRLQLPAATPALPVLITRFAAPRSYTGQDLVEIQLPGNPALLDRVIHAITARGARPAEPGEFTFRAYLAGKLDLTQAEGIAATIAATSDSQLHAATLLRQGRLGSLATELVDAIGAQLALVEAGIDFTDQDDVVPITPGRLDANLAQIESTLVDLLARSRSWGALEALPRIVLVGEPSAGKSTLFNALLGRHRAVISPTPGTTRDLLAEPLILTSNTGQPLEVMLIDIAGLDEAHTAIDRQMQAAAHQAIHQADLILHLIPHAACGFAPITGSLPASPAACGFAPLPDTPPHTPIIQLLTKSDLAKTHPNNENNFTNHETIEHENHLPNHPTLAISAHTGHHLNQLRALILHHLGQRAISIAADMLALQPRHQAALQAARADLATARQLLAPQTQHPAITHIELIANALRNALNELAALGGTLTPDDVIGRVFATFCIGK